MGLSMRCTKGGVMDPTSEPTSTPTSPIPHCRARDVPHIEVSWLDDEDLHNPTGIKRGDRDRRYRGGHRKRRVHATGSDTAHCPSHLTAYCDRDERR